MRGEAEHKSAAATQIQYTLSVFKSRERRVKAGCVAAGCNIYTRCIHIEGPTDRYLRAEIVGVKGRQKGGEDA